MDRSNPRFTPETVIPNIQEVYASCFQITKIYITGEDAWLMHNRPGYDPTVHICCTYSYKIGIYTLTYGLHDEVNNILCFLFV